LGVIRNPKLARKAIDLIRGGKSPEEVAKLAGEDPLTIRIWWATGWAAKREELAEWYRNVKTRKGCLHKRDDFLWWVACGKTPYDVADELAIPRKYVPKWMKQHEMELEAYRVKAQRGWKLRKMADELAKKAITTKEEIIEAAGDVLSGYILATKRAQELLSNDELVRELAKQKSGITDLIRCVGDESVRTVGILQQLKVQKQDEELDALPQVASEADTSRLEC